METGAVLKHLVARPAGVPLTMAQLRALGISPQLAQGYLRHGWLNRLGRGVYVRPGAPLDLSGSLRALEDLGFKAHVGGKTALDWYGTRDQVAARPQVLLYGVGPQRLPTWLTESFDVLYRRRRLFRERETAPLAVSRFRDDPAAPMTAEPERAVLELLSEVPQRESLEEARILASGLVSLRPDVMGALLKACSNVKTVRLFLMLARESSLPVLERLDTRKLPTGSRSRWVMRTGDSTLILKP